MEKASVVVSEEIIFKVDVEALGETVSKKAVAKGKGC
jgi:hypothetical protein